MPNLLIIAGPNGAGKTTAAHVVLPEIMPEKRYINADYIAAGMNPFAPERSAIAAGRSMLKEIHHALQNKEDFAFETTLSTRSFVPFIKKAQAQGYRVNIIYLWLSSPEFAIARVKARVLSGGHNVPEAVIRRRYERSRRNFLELYRPLVQGWKAYDNSGEEPVLIAQGNGITEIKRSDIWQILTA